MKSLLQEFSANDLTKSDGSDAGKNDVSAKAGSGDVKFSLMRNTINADGKITGSDVANYLEKASDLNDDVETVVYGLETSDGEVVKVYVNATQADAFEAEMKKMLGMEDDIEEAINDLATRFDIVDVVWPKGTGPDAAGEEGDDVDLDDSADIGDPSLGDEAPTDDENDDDMDVIAADDTSPEDEAPVDKAEADEPEEEEPKAEKPKKKPAASTEEEPEEEETAASKPAPKKGDKHSNLSNVGSKMKKVKEGVEAQGANMSIGNKFLTRVLAESQLDEAGMRQRKQQSNQRARDRDGDGYDIVLDAQQQALASKLRYPLPKKIIQLFSLIGVPGNKLNSAGAEESVAEAAELLRTNLTVRRAFNAFFDLFATVKGKKIAAEPAPVQEGRLKRGNFLQKQLETVLVKLGMPESLVSTTGPGVVGTALYKASKDIEDNGELKAALRMLAVRMGLKPSDAMAELDDKAMTEAIDPSGADLYADAVMMLVEVLGVPEEAFARNARMILGTKFRNDRKLMNAGALTAMVKRFTTTFAQAKSRVTRANPNTEPTGTQPTR
jgi:hypothetical protein